MSFQPPPFPRRVLSSLGALGFVFLAGCAYSHGTEADANPQSGEITYSNQVSRLFQDHCESCHREDGLGPFPLTSFDEVKAMAPRVREAVETRSMPHGMPIRLDTGCSEADTFFGPRRLTQSEVDTVVAWVDSGAPEGDPEDLPPSKNFTDGEWILGQPDIELPNAKDGFLVPANVGRDLFRRFVLPTDFGGDRFITGFEAIPGTPGGTGLSHIVHHVTLFIAEQEAALARERAFAASSPEIPGPGFEGDFGFPTTLVGMWFPGSAPLELGGDLGIRVPEGAAIIMEVHYAPSTEAITDRTIIGLRLVDNVSNELSVGLVKDETFVVPAGAPAFEVTAERIIEETATLYSITPHMHQLGTDFRVVIERPTSDELCLADVAWDFEHQGTSWLQEPMELPAGSRIRVSCRYNNTTDNPNQFHFPPQNVIWGKDAQLEMCQLTIGILAGAKAPSPEKPRLVEVLYDAEGDDADAEWVKLHNPGDVDIDLSEYSLGWAGEAYYYGSLNLSGILPAGACVVVGAQPPGATGLPANFVPDLQNSGIIADGVAIFEGAAASISASSVPVDTVLYGQSNDNGLLDSSGAVSEVHAPDAPAGSSLRRNGEVWEIGLPQPSTCP